MSVTDYSISDPTTRQLILDADFENLASFHHTVADKARNLTVDVASWFRQLPPVADWNPPSR